MEYVISLFLLVVVFLSFFILKKSIDLAKRNGKLDDSEIVSKQFYQNACEVVRLMTEAESKKQQDRELPCVIFNLRDEVIKHKKAKIAKQNKNYTAPV